MRARSDWFLSDPSGLVTYRLRERLALPPARPSSLGSPGLPHPVPRLPVFPTMEAGGVTTKPPDGLPSSQAGSAPNVALRRRLSDKDKERRLVSRRKHLGKNMKTCIICRYVGVAVKEKTRRTEALRGARMALM